jgi:hypothetical protein
MLSSALAVAASPMTTAADMTVWRAAPARGHAVAAARKPGGGGEDESHRAIPAADGLGSVAVHLRGSFRSSHG